MKKNNLIIILALLLVSTVLVSSLSIGDILTSAKNNPNQYYVLCMENNSEIISIARNFSNELGVGFSSSMIQNKNPIVFLLPPSLYGYLYTFENNFSYAQVIEGEEANVLLLYFSKYNRSNSEIETEVKFTSEYLIKNYSQINADYFLIINDSVAFLQGLSCEGFNKTSINQKNSFVFQDKIFEDSCVNITTLLKMDCLDSLSFTPRFCVYGCFEGRCLNEEEANLGFFSTMRKWILEDKETPFQVLWKLIRDWAIRV